MLGGHGGNVASVVWQVKLCDPICHASSRSADATVGKCPQALNVKYLVRDQQQESEGDASHQGARASADRRHSSAMTLVALVESTNDNSFKVQ